MAIKEKVDALRKELQEKYGLNVLVQLKGFRNLNEGMNKEKAWNILHEISGEYECSTVKEFNLSKTELIAYEFINKEDDLEIDIFCREEG